MKNSKEGFRCRWMKVLNELSSYYFIVCYLMTTINDEISH